MTRILLSLAAVFGTIVTVALGVFSIFRRGEKHGKQQIESEQNEKTLKEISDASKIRNHVNSMSDDDLDKWMRKNLLKK